MDPSMQRLWRWHAVEETEHKAVAYDVYQQVIRSVWLRRLALFQATMGFLAEVCIRNTVLLYQDRQLKPRVLWNGFKRLFGRNGFIRALAPDLLAFGRVSFHPDDIDNQALLTQRKSEWALD